MRTLIIRPAALGDTLMLAPALSCSAKWGEVVVAGRKPGIDLLRPLVSTCLDFEGPGWHSLFMDVPEAGASLPAKDTGKVIAFLNDPQGVVGRNLVHFFPGASIAVLPGYPGKDQPVHVALHLARALEQHRLPMDAGKVMKDAMRRPLLLSTRRARSRIVFHPGSGGQQKNHDPGFWLDLLRAFRERIAPTQGKPAILLGPAEEDLNPLFSKVKDTEILLFPDMGRLSLLLQEALLYIGHDSGITHLAAMLGTPTLALFRNTSVAQWHPLGPRVKVIQANSSGPELLEETLKAANGYRNEYACLW